MGQAHRHLQAFVPEGHESPRKQQAQAGASRQSAGRGETVVGQEGCSGSKLGVKICSWSAGKRPHMLTAVAASS